MRLGVGMIADAWHVHSGLSVYGFHTVSWSVALALCLGLNLFMAVGNIDY